MVILFIYRIVASTSPIIPSFDSNKTFILLNITLNNSSIFSNKFSKAKIDLTLSLNMLANENQTTLARTRMTRKITNARITVNASVDSYCFLLFLIILCALYCNVPITPISAISTLLLSNGLLLLCVDQSFCLSTL